MRVHPSDLDHGDAVLDGADIDAEIAADALVFHHLEMPDTIDEVGDRLVRGVLAGDVTAAALDAGVAIEGGKVTHDGKNIGSSHIHGGVVSGGDLTDVPAN